MGIFGKDRDAALAIYLNDHLAGAVAGVGLARRLADGGSIPADVANEIEEDRAALVDLMRTLDVPVRKYKAGLGWAAEKVGRLKLNGRLVGRAPLSRVLELETMRLGVEGKAAGWRTLRIRADVDTRLDGARLDRLIERAGKQIELLEAARITAAAEVFVGEAPFERHPVRPHGEV
jgi:hypothetical protein